MNREQYYLALKNSLSVRHACTEAAGQAAFHFHDDYKIYLFLGGDVEFYVEQSVYPLKRGHLLICNDSELHRVHHFGRMPYERVIIHFDHRLVQGLSTASTDLLHCFRDRPQGTRNAVLLDEEQIQYILGISSRLEDISDKANYGSDVLTNAYLCELLVWVNHRFEEGLRENDGALIHSASAAGLVGEVRAYVEEHLAEELSLGRISERFSVEPSHLSQLFKRQAGSTLYQYILTKRIAVAKRYLSEGASVTEACGLSGFNDYSNFIRTFKKLTGVSPGKYSAYSL